MAQKRRSETDDDLARDLLADGDPTPPDALIFDEQGQLVSTEPAEAELPGEAVQG